MKAPKISIGEILEQMCASPLLPAVRGRLQRIRLQRCVEADLQELNSCRPPSPSHQKTSRHLNKKIHQIKATPQRSLHVVATTTATDKLNSNSTAPLSVAALATSRMASNRVHHVTKLSATLEHPEAATSYRRSQRKQ